MKLIFKKRIITAGWENAQRQRKIMLCLAGEHVQYANPGYREERQLAEEPRSSRVDLLIGQVVFGWFFWFFSSPLKLCFSKAFWITPTPYLPPGRRHGVYTFEFSCSRDKYVTSKVGDAKKMCVLDTHQNTYYLGRLQEFYCWSEKFYTRHGALGLCSSHTRNTRGRQQESGYKLHCRSLHTGNVHRTLTVINTASLYFYSPFISPYQLTGNLDLSNFCLSSAKNPFLHHEDKP